MRLGSTLTVNLRGSFFSLPATRTRARNGRIQLQEEKQAQVSTGEFGDGGKLLARLARHTNEVHQKLLLAAHRTLDQNTMSWQIWSRQGRMISHLATPMAAGTARKVSALLSWNMTIQRLPALAHFSAMPAEKQEVEISGLTHNTARLTAMRTRSGEQQVNVTVACSGRANSARHEDPARSLNEAQRESNAPWLMVIIS